MEKVVYKIVCINPKMFLKLLGMLEDEYFLNFLFLIFSEIFPEYYYLHYQNKTMAPKVDKGKSEAKPLA